MFLLFRRKVSQRALCIAAKLDSILNSRVRIAHRGPQRYRLRYMGGMGLCLPLVGSLFAVNQFLAADSLLASPCFITSLMIFLVTSNGVICEEQGPD